jgi:hypothetical protein
MVANIASLPSTLTFVTGRFCTRKRPEFAGGASWEFVLGGFCSGTCWDGAAACADADANANMVQQKPITNRGIIFIMRLSSRFLLGQGFL